jgi:hypothetical protein
MSVENKGQKNSENPLKNKERVPKSQKKLLRAMLNVPIRLKLGREEPHKSKNKDMEREKGKQIYLWCSVTHFSCRLLRAHYFPPFAIATTFHYLLLCNHHNQNMWILSVTTPVHGRFWAPIFRGSPLLF